MKERANTLVKQRAASREERANNSLRAALHRTGRWEKKKKQNKKGGNSSATRVSGNLLQKQLFSVDTSICFYAFANEMRFIQ